MYCASLVVRVRVTVMADSVYWETLTKGKFDKVSVKIF